MTDDPRPQTPEDTQNDTHAEASLMNPGHPVEHASFALPPRVVGALRRAGLPTDDPAALADRVRSMPVPRPARGRWCAGSTNQRRRIRVSETAVSRWGHARRRNVLNDAAKLTIRVSPKVRDQIRAEAERDGTRQAAIVRRALRLGLIEIAKRDGGELPPDHLETAQGPEIR
jgi:hypothetical protein